MFQQILELQNRCIKNGVPGNDCIIFHKGKEVYRHYEGFSDYENQIPMNGKERYNIYSCSKPITCTAALQLYEKGKLSLEDKLEKYIPAFSHMKVKTKDGLTDCHTPITIKHLFCMTAGLNYDDHSESLEQARIETAGRCQTVETMNYLAKEPLEFEPSSQWNYSLCHDVLAAVVEIISGMRFGEYVRQNIFNPLGMSHSTFLLPDDELDSLCAQYRFEDNGHKRVRCSKELQISKMGTEYESGGAGCISTVDDYIKFLEALRIGDIILKRKTIDLMSTDMLTEAQKATYWREGYSYGLGVRCPLPNGVLRDFGWGGAAGAYLAINRETEYTLYYAQHALSSPVHEERLLINKAAADLFSRNC